MSSHLFNATEQQLPDFFERHILKTNRDGTLSANVKGARRGFFGLCGKAWRWVFQPSTHMKGVRNIFQTALNQESSKEITNADELQKAINLYTNAVNFDLKVITKHEARFWTTIFFWTKVPHLSSETIDLLLNRIQNHFDTVRLRDSKIELLPSQINQLSRLFNLYQQLSPTKKAEDFGFTQEKVCGWLTAMDNKLKQAIGKIEQGLSDNQWEEVHAENLRFVQSFEAENILTDIDSLIPAHTHTASLQSATSAIFQSIGKVKTISQQIKSNQQKLENWIQTFSELNAFNETINTAALFKESPIAKSEINQLLTLKYLPRESIEKLKGLIANYDSLKSGIDDSKALSHYIQQNESQLFACTDSLQAIALETACTLFEQRLDAMNLPVSLKNEMKQKLQNHKRVIESLTKALDYCKELFSPTLDFSDPSISRVLNLATEFSNKLDNRFVIKNRLKDRIHYIELQQKERIQGAEELCDQLQHLISKINNSTLQNLGAILGECAIDLGSLRNYLAMPLIESAQKRRLEELKKEFDDKVKFGSEVYSLLSQLNRPTDDPLAQLKMHLTSTSSQWTEITRLGRLTSLYNHIKAVRKAWQLRLVVRILNLKETYNNAAKLKSNLEELKVLLPDLFGLYPSSDVSGMLDNLLTGLYRAKRDFEDATDPSGQGIYFNFIADLKELVGKPKDELDKLWRNIRDFNVSLSREEHDEPIDFDIMVNKARLLNSSPFFTEEVASNPGFSKEMQQMAGTVKQVATVVTILNELKLCLPQNMIQKLLNPVVSSVSPYDYKSLKEKFLVLRKSLSHIAVYSFLHGMLKEVRPLEEQLQKEDSDLLKAFKLFENNQKICQLNRKISWTLSDYVLANELIHKETVLNGEKEKTNLRQKVEEKKLSFAPLFEEFSALRVEIGNWIETQNAQPQDSRIKSLNLINLPPELKEKIKNFLAKDIGDALKKELSIFDDLARFNTDALAFCEDFAKKTSGRANEFIEQNQAFLSSTPPDKRYVAMTALVNNPFCPPSLKKQIEIILKSFALGFHPKQESSIEMELMTDAVYFPTPTRGLYHIYNGNELIRLFKVRLKKICKEAKEQAKSPEYELTAPITGLKIPHFFTPKLVWVKSNPDDALEEVVAIDMEASDIKTQDKELRDAGFQPLSRNYHRVMRSFLETREAKARIEARKAAESIEDRAARLERERDEEEAERIAREADELQEEIGRLSGTIKTKLPTSTEELYISQMLDYLKDRFVEAPEVRLLVKGYKEAFPSRQEDEDEGDLFD